MEANSSILLNESEVVFYDSTTSTLLWILSVVVLSITFVLGVLGNGLVICVAGFQMAHAVTTLCYLNLALGDFSFMATLTIHIISMILKGKWLFGNIWNKETPNSIHIFLNPASTLASFNNCLNPILYAFRGQEFRKKLIYSLSATLDRALREDSVLSSGKSSIFSSFPADSEL